MRRLRWSPYGSSLSRHDKNDSHECVGQDPIKDPIIRTKIEQAARNEASNGMRIFTLVDTNTMTVTLFEAARPPSVLLLCAVEVGMQRAIACSYQWMTGTCYRETALRLETPVLEKMSRVSRVKLGAFRKQESFRWACYSHTVLGFFVLQLQLLNLCLSALFILIMERRAFQLT